MSEETTETLTREANTTVPSSETTETLTGETNTTVQTREKKGGNNSIVVSIFIFLGTFLGSLLGVAADLGDARDTIANVIDAVNPATSTVIAGSDTVLGTSVGMAADWNASFIDLNKWKTWQGVPVVGPIDRTYKLNINPTGTLDGLQLALDGQVNLLAASEPLADADWVALSRNGLEPMCAAEIGYDIISFVTYLGNTVPDLRMRDLEGILTGSITNWSEVGGEDVPIHVLVREGSGTTQHILAPLNVEPPFPSTFISCESNDDCLDQALGLPGALYWVSTSWLHTQPPRYLRFILVRRGNLPPQNPLDAENFNPDNYPPQLIRPLYMYVLQGNSLDAEQTDLARKFFHFVRSRNGQQVLESHRFFTYFDPPTDLELTLPAGFGLAVDGIPVVCQEG